MLKIIYKIWKKKFNNYLVEDMLLDVPQNITDEAVAILAKQRGTVTKWLYFQAHVLSRRDISDIGSIDIKHGMLIEIKSLIQLLGKAKEVSIDHPEKGTLVAVPDDWKKDIETFKAGKVEIKQEVNK